MARSGSFEEFYTGTVGRLLGQLFLVTGDLHDAEEIVQEAYTRAAALRLRPGGTLSPVGRRSMAPLGWRVLHVRYRTTEASTVPAGGCGRSHSDARMGCIVSSTTASSSPVRVSRSTCWRSRSLNAAIVWAAS
jgi:RNA polymerase sigma-70 factor (ECF subfamily)